MKTLAEALDAWRVNPDPVARAEVLSHAASQAAPRGDPEAFQLAWLERAQAPDAPTIGWLAETLGAKVPTRDVDLFDDGSAKRRHAPLLERVRALAALPRDPRITDGALAVVRKTFTTGYDETGPRDVYDPLFALIEAQADPGALEPLEALASGAPWKVQGVREHCAVRAHQALRRLAEIAWKPSETAVLEQPPAPRASEAELLEAIQLAPHDRDLRAVYADVLVERNEPRGRFIALQLAGETVEAAKLLRAHRAAWLGPVLDRVFVSPAFVDGFLHSAELAGNAKASELEWVQAAADPRVSTLVHLGRGRSGNARNHRLFLTSPVCRALQDAQISGKADLDAFLDGPNAGRTRTLQLDFGPSRAQWDRLVATMTALQDLTLQTTLKREQADQALLEKLGLTARLTSVKTVLSAREERERRFSLRKQELGLPPR